MYAALAESGTRIGARAPARLPARAREAAGRVRGHPSRVRQTPRDSQPPPRSRGRDPARATKLVVGWDA